MSAATSSLRRGGQAGAEHRTRLGLALVLLLQTLLITAFRQRIPVGEGPDEATHLAYAAHLLEGRGLPKVVPGEQPLTQATHPPLYYALGALIGRGDRLTELHLPGNPFFSANLMDRVPVPNIHLHPAHGTGLRPGERAAMRMRWLSMACAWIVVLGCYSMLRRWLPDRPLLALSAAATLAFWPAFVFAASVFSNDMGANAAAAVALAGAASLAAGGRREPNVLLTTGLALGLGLLSKLTVLGLVPVVGAAWLWGRRRDVSPAPWWRDLLALGLPLALAFGWWPLRNMALYGIDQPLGAAAFQQVAGTMMRTEPFLPELPRFLALQVQTLLGRFGWVSVPQPLELYRWLGPGLGAVVVGGGLAVAWPRGQTASAEEVARQRDEDRRTLLACFVGFVPVYLLVLQLALRLNLVAAHARYFYAGLPLLSATLTLCWSRLWPASWRMRSMLLLPAGVLCWSLWVALAVIGPAYRMPTAAAAGSELLVRYGKSLVLRSVRAEVVRGEASHGQLRLTLRMGLDSPAAIEPDERGLLLFAQLLVDGDRKLGQVDTPPFDGRFPFEAWQPGQDFSVPLVIDLSPGFESEVAEVLIGVYPEDAPERRLEAFAADGRELPERALRLVGSRLAPGPIDLRPPSAPAP